MKYGFYSGSLASDQHFRLQRKVLSHCCTFTCKQNGNPMFLTPLVMPTELFHTNYCPLLSESMNIL